MFFYLIPCPLGDPENICVLECISLCVLVVAYDSGTKRARQMLAILNAILPYFLRDLVRDKKSEPKATRETIHQLTVTMKALINNCDELTKYELFIIVLHMLYCIK